jgi:hypothetical protein
MDLQTGYQGQTLATTRAPLRIAGAAAFLAAVLVSACASTPPAPKVKDFFFTVSPVPATGGLQIKSGSPQHGLYENGYAVIKVHRGDQLTLAWECPGNRMTLAIYPMVNDENDVPKLKLTKEKQGTNPMDPEEFDAQDRIQVHLFAETDRKGTEAYKYDLACGDGKVDPVIIINR